LFLNVYVVKGEGLWSTSSRVSVACRVAGESIHGTTGAIQSQEYPLFGTCVTFCKMDIWYALNTVLIIIIIIIGQIK